MAKVRAFLSSPFRSHVMWELKGPQPAFRDTMCSMIATGLDIVLSVSEVRSHPRNCIWSPLIEGEILRADEFLEDEIDALKWCLWNLEHAGFTHLICASDDTIPRRPDYGRNGCDAEVKRAHEFGLVVMRETEFTGLWP